MCLDVHDDGVVCSACRVGVESARWVQAPAEEAEKDDGSYTSSARAKSQARYSLGMARLLMKCLSMALCVIVAFSAFCAYMGGWD